MIGIKPDISQAIAVLCPEGVWAITEEDFDRIDWQSPDVEQPSKSAIQAKLAELQAAEPMRVMREQRDQSLKETDVYMVTDHPTSKADEWKTYRQELRDMPSKETPLLQPDGSLSNVTWPTKPE